MGGRNIFHNTCVSELFEALGVIFLNRTRISICQEIFPELTENHPLDPYPSQDHKIVRNGIKPHHYKLDVSILQLVNSNTEVAGSGGSAKTSAAAPNALL